MSLLRRLNRAVLAVTTGALVATLSTAYAGNDAVEPTAAITMSSASTPSAHRLALPWGHTTSKHDEAYGAYLAAGRNKALLGRIALRPRARWFGGWVPTKDVTSRIGAYVAASQNGDRDALVQLATFRLYPHHGESGRSIPLTKADQDSYKAWVRAAAKGIGSARAAVIVEPDLAVALKGWKPSVRFYLASYAVRTFAALPRTSVYLDASDADWLKVDAAVSMLRSAGIARARGFALGATHYSSIKGNRLYADAIINRLDRVGIKARHAVLDTADNGQAFTYREYFAKHPRGDFDNAEVCRSRSEHRCDTLGHPPTPYIRAIKGTRATNIDGYLWFGRPWLYRQAAPWRFDRAVALARTTPYR